MKRSRIRFAILTLMLCVGLFWANNCVVKKVYLEQNELGIVDIYGFIKHGTPEPGLREKIADRDVAVISQGLLYDYYKKKTKLQKYIDKYGEI